MKKLMVLLVVSFLAVSAFGATRKVFILFEPKTRHIDRITELRRSIEQAGGRTRAVFGVAGVVAELDASVVSRVAAPAHGVRTVYDGPVAVPASTDPETLAAVTAWNSIITDKPVAKRPAAMPPQGGPPTDVSEPPDRPRDRFEAEKAEAAYRMEWAAARPNLPARLQSSIGCGSNGAGYFDTSLYFAGDIAVGVFYVNGTINNNPAGWSPAGSATTASTVQTFADVASALDRFLTIQPNARITFTYVNEVDGFGNPLPSPANERTYVNNMRNTNCTDWGFLISMVNGGVWPNAYLYGPSLRMDRNFGFFEEVLDHEVGHMFGAGDAYAPAGPSPRFGYLLAAHANACGQGGGFFGGAGECLDDLMAGWGNIFQYNTIVGPSTAGQLGWHATAGDGILDVTKTKPLINAATVVSSVNATTFAVTFNGVAIDRAVLNEQSGYGNVSINRIANVQYRVGNTPWQDATPVDGFWDSGQEAFQFTTPPLRSNSPTVQIRAINTIGAVTPVPYEQQLTLTASTVTNTRPFASLVVTPERAKINTTITAFSASSRDLETGPLVYSWKWDNGPWSGFTSAVTATKTFTTAGPHTVQLRVRDGGALIHLLARTVTAETFDTPPVIALGVTQENRHFSATANYPITMTVFGSRDAETPFAQLRVQWDVDCDGWDGPASLVKTKTVTLVNLKNPNSDRRRVCAQVLDASNNSSQAERLTWLVPYNHPPAIGGFVTTPSGSNYLVTVAATDPDFTTTWDGILEYRFDFEGDGIWDTQFGPGNSSTVPAANLTTFIVEVIDRFHARAIRAACFPLQC
jgi:hypothetical protein